METMQSLHGELTDAQLDQVAGGLTARYEAGLTTVGEIGSVVTPSGIGLPAK